MKMMGSKFHGSTLAIILGVLQFLGAVGRIGNGDTSADPQTGLVIILGALAYKSIKKRAIGLRNDSLLRKSIEVFFLGFAGFLIAGQNDFMNLIEEKPFQNIVIPLWIYYACYLAFKHTKDYRTLAIKGDRKSVV